MNLSENLRRWLDGAGWEHISAGGARLIFVVLIGFRMVVISARCLNRLQDRLISRCREQGEASRPFDLRMYEKAQHSGNHVGDGG